MRLSCWQQEWRPPCHLRLQSVLAPTGRAAGACPCSEQLVYFPAYQAHQVHHMLHQLDISSAVAAADFEQWGGFDFHTQKPQVEVFVGAQGVEFWVEDQVGIPDMTVRLGNIKGVSWGWRTRMLQHAPLQRDAREGWSYVLLPLLLLCTELGKIPRVRMAGSMAQGPAAVLEEASAKLVLNAPA